MLAPQKPLSPKQLAALADKYYMARQKRLAEQKKVDQLEESEKSLRNQIMEELKAQKVESISGKVGCAGLSRKQFPKISDQEAFDKFAKKKGNEDLVKKTLNAVAVKERWEDGKLIPGVSKEEVITLSITKV